MALVAERSGEECYFLVFVGLIQKYGTNRESVTLQSAPDAAWLRAFFQGAGPVLQGATVHIYPFDHNDVGGDAHTHSSSTSRDPSRSSRRRAVGTLDPVCTGEASASWARGTAGRGRNLPWCNFSRVLWPGPGELFDTRPVQDFALPFAAIVRQHAPAAAQSLRIGETAAVNHGGWDNVTNAFVSGFWSVYQMGWLAQAGYAVVHRQSLTCRGGYSGMGNGERCSYGVLSNAPRFAPTPDYWVALLHKRLMGRRVLNVTTSISDANSASPIGTSSHAELR
eukprot:SAG31_NODE_12373_length_946_cov_1.652893_2_plen_279_part_01